MNKTVTFFSILWMAYAVTAYGAQAYSTVALTEPLGNQGTVTFSIRTDKTYHTGPEAAAITMGILEIPGVAQFRFSQSSTVCELQWMWARGVKADNLMVEVPALAGPEEYIIQYTWDAAAGLFTGYVNGTALRLPEMTLTPWKMPDAGEVRLLESPFQPKLISCSARYLDETQIQALIPESMLGKHAHLFGVPEKEMVPLQTTDRLGRLLYETNMDAADSVEGWVMEGPGKTTFEDGWMKLFSTDSESILKKGHIVYWCPEIFPKSFVAEWDIQILSEEGLCIVFFAASGPNGKDVLDNSLPRRTGIFRQYTRGAINCYHISYYANTPTSIGRITSNMRKNSGFYLVSNGPPGIEPGSDAVHKLRLIKDGAHVQFQVDGKVIIDFMDDGQSYGPVLGGGEIALRQMQWTKARYRNFRVYELNGQ